MFFSRSHVLVAAALSAAVALALTGCSPAADATDSELPTGAPQPSEAVSSEVFDALEEQYEARLGVYAIDTGTGETVQFRAAERFAFASTFKALAVGALLQQRAIDELDQVVRYDVDDLVDYSPITESAAGTGMSLRELAAAAVQYSDNSAANFIVDQLGGPDGFDAALAGLGDHVTVAEREETSLNDYTPGDDSDTSTPRAFATDLYAFALGDVLEQPKRDLLSEWLKGNTTGDALIRAGVPDGWEVGDKTGTAAYGTRNDIAVIWPPTGDPIVLAIFSDKSTSDAEHDDALIADTTAHVIDMLEDKTRTRDR